MRHSIADFDAGPKSASEKFEVALAVATDRGRTHGRLVSYVAGGTPWAGAADTLSNHSSTALVGCLRTVGSALAATATVGAVAQHWRSWMVERSARLVAGKPDWTWVSARGSHRSEYPPKSSPRCAG